MLAPLAASLFRYGACVITQEQCLFSKITTTMWSGRGTADLSFMGAGGRTAACGVSVGSIPASGVVQHSGFRGGRYFRFRNGQLYGLGLSWLRRHNCGKAAGGCRRRGG
jgi:hypothetical protein